MKNNIKYNKKENDTEKKLDCPKCSVFMKREFHMHYGHIYVCPICGCVFLSKEQAKLDWKKETKETYLNKEIYLKDLLYE